MSVILFSSTDEVYYRLARSYEGLKGFAARFAYRAFTDSDDYQFYKALRRLYFANVATYLCQYHDESPLSPHELQSIETFTEPNGFSAPVHASYRELVGQFLQSWGHLKYNLVTNDGEMYKPYESFTYIDDLAQCYRRALILARLQALTQESGGHDDQS